MLYDDQPISQDEEDKLNRTPFVDEIVELINRYTEYDEKKDNHAGLVIGLEGAWGSGKTSILNLLENKFQERKEKYVVQRLDSWLALDCTALAAEFFKMLGIAAVDTGAFLGKHIYKEYQKLFQVLLRVSRYQFLHLPVRLGLILKSFFIVTHFGKKKKK